MATSVPSKNGNDSGSAVELTYSGKLPRTQVLAEPANTTFRAVQKSDSPNRLFCGDNLAALKALVGDPTVQGKVSVHSGHIADVESCITVTPIRKKATRRADRAADGFSRHAL